MADDRRAGKLRRYSTDIVPYAESVIAKLADISLEHFSSDLDLIHLVSYRLQCASEATKNALALEPEIAGRHPKIPWSQVKAIGNRVRHEYGDIRADVLWEAVRGDDVHLLVDAAEAELKRDRCTS